MKYKFLILLGTILFVQSFLVVAHCPLCTVGIAAAAGGAAYLGVNKAVIALFVGAFAVSTGWWVGRKVKKKIIPAQVMAIVILSFLLTVIPLLPLLSQIYPLYISWGGSYGSLFNRTYVINLSLITSLLGGLIVGFTPWLSHKINQIKGWRKIPFQGILLTLLLLILTGATIQLVM